MDSSHWIRATADEPVRRVAKRALRKRLQNVLRYLPRAAKRSNKNGAESLHQLRVAGRRAMAALDFYGPLLPVKRCRWLKKQLQRLIKATGPARDDDVIAQRLTLDAGIPGAIELLERVRIHREKSQLPVRKLHRRLKKKDRLRRRCRQLIKRVRLRRALRGTSITYSDWVELQMHCIVERFARASRADFSVVKGLHQLRIVCKQLRYGLELAALAMPPTLRDELFPALSGLQRELGDVHDLATAQARIHQRRGPFANSENGNAAHLLAQAVQTQLENKLAPLQSESPPTAVRRVQSLLDRWLDAGTPRMKA